MLLRVINVSCTALFSSSHELRAEQCLAWCAKGVSDPFVTFLIRSPVCDNCGTEVHTQAFTQQHLCPVLAQQGWLSAAGTMVWWHLFVPGSQKLLSRQLQVPGTQLVMAMLLLCLPCCLPLGGCAAVRRAVYCLKAAEAQGGPGEGAMCADRAAG